MISMRPGSVVYAIGSTESTRVKIGKAKNLPNRFKAIQAMCPIPLTVLWYAPGGYPLETKLHNIFKSRRTHGEWFDFAGQDAVDLLNVAAAHIREGGSPKALKAAMDALNLTRAAMPEPDMRTLSDVWHFGDVLYDICGELAWSLIDHTRSLHRFSSWDELLWSEVDAAAMRLHDAIGKTRTRFALGLDEPTHVTAEENHDRPEYPGRSPHRHLLA